MIAIWGYNLMRLIGFSLVMFGLLVWTPAMSATGKSCGLSLFDIIYELKRVNVDCQHQQSERIRYFLGLFSSNSQPSIFTPGHTWVNMISISEEGDIARIHSFQSIGFKAREEGDECLKLTYFPLLNELLSWACYDGALVQESVFNISSDEGVTFSKPRNKEGLERFVGGKFEQGYIRELSHSEFSRVNYTVSKYSETTYKAVLSDCIGFIQEVGASAGLVMPSRLYGISPENYMMHVRMLNSRGI